MKKIISFLFVVMIITFSNVNIAKSQCEAANAMSSTPAWMDGGSVSIKICDGCHINYKYCYRVNTNGDREVVITKYWVTDVNVIVDCVHEAKDLDITKLDYFMRKVCYVDDRFQDANRDVDCDENGNPPTTAGAFFKVYESKCLSEWILDPVTSEFYKEPCNGALFCSYEYRFCQMMINGILTLITKRTSTGPNTNACPEDHIIGLGVYECFAKDCYPDQGPIKAPDEEDFLNPLILDDDDYYNLYNIQNMLNSQP